MAVEAKRGCGYRKVGGLYLVADGLGSPCCKMPLELTICPCCGAGIRQARGWTWVDAGKMFPSGGCSADPLTKATCPAVNPALMGRVGLIWIGERFYKRPVDFMMEAQKQGVSRRLHNVPREFKAGETWVLFAHPKAIEKPRKIADNGEGWFTIERADGREEAEPRTFDSMEKAVQIAAERDLADPVFVPGVVYVTKPRGFEKIVKQSEFDLMLDERASWEADERDDRDGYKGDRLVQFERDAVRGIKWVPVPDEDKDHQGTVYDDEEPATAGGKEAA